MEASFEPTSLISTSLCSVLKARAAPRALIEGEFEDYLKNCLNFLDNFQKAVEMKTIEDFHKKFMHNSGCHSQLLSTIPVYIFNPSKLMSATICQSQILRDLMKKSAHHAVVVDCSEIESKTDFFSTIFEGIVGGDGTAASPMNISYDFSCFLKAFNAIKPRRDVVIIFDNAAQINLSHLDDFVRLWERKSKDFAAQPRLKFVFDDVVCFLGMEARLRDRFQLIESEIPRIVECFDEFVVELVRSEMKFVLDSALMKRFVSMAESETFSFNAIMNQIKFLIISHFNGLKSINKDDYNAQNNANFKSIFLFISNLNAKLMKLRPSAHVLSPAKNFYSPLYSGLFADSQCFAEILSELKSLNPNDFASLFIDSDSGLKEGHKVKLSALEDYKVKVLESMKKETVVSLKDLQIDLVSLLYELIKSSSIEIPSNWIISDPRGNLRRAFEADPQAALQVALKYPSFYLNCQRKCCMESTLIGPINSSNLNASLAPLHHNRPSMPDVSLLYRLSLEFPNKTVNLLQWYRSFLSVIGAKNSSPLLISRFFKALNELQIIGMVSEFGRSKRKRRSVDRFNITDTLEFEYE